MKFCDKLQKIRKENNITQETLADKLNVSRQAVSKWESGQAYPDTEKLIQISKIFNVSLDELINDNIDKSSTDKNKRMSFMDIINYILEFLTKSVNMFWSMKFLEKIKCLFEITILVLIIFFVAMLSTAIMEELFRRLIMFLPSNLMYSLCNLFVTLLYLAWLVLGMIIVIKIFKIRYLDYYVFVTDESVSEKTIEEPIKELKEKKEYKVVIRDPKDSSFNILSKIGKICMFFIKCFCLMIGIPLVIFFILCVLVLVFSLFYIIDGLFFIGMTIAIIGVLLFLYLMIEFIYNLLFNRKHAVNRIFKVFIGSISLMGIGLGLSFTSLSNFTYENNVVKKTDIHNIEMTDNLVITSMIYNMDYNDVVIDNSLDNIKLEIANYGNNDVYLYSYDEYSYNDSSKKIFKVMDIKIDYDGLQMYRDVINDLKNKKIVNYDTNYNIKMYISESNLTKLRENMNKYTGIIYFE